MLRYDQLARNSEKSICFHLAVILIRTDYNDNKSDIQTPLLTESLSGAYTLRSLVIED